MEKRALFGSMPFKEMLWYETLIASFMVRRSPEEGTAVSTGVCMEIHGLAVKPREVLKIVCDDGFHWSGR